MPATRRSSMKGRRSQPSVANLESTQTNTLDSTVSSTPASTSRRTVITEEVVERYLGNEGSPQSPSLADELEEWELKPKTDYTYVRSPSYSQKYIGQVWVKPNMSRPRLRGGKPLELSPTSCSSLSDLVSVSQADNRHMPPPLDQTYLHESYVRQPSTSSRRSSRRSTASYATVTDKTLDEEHEVMMRDRLTDSVTRSGRRTRSVRKPSVESSATDMTDMSLKDYMMVEKQLEYSGGSGLKEGSRVSLYGLDQADELEDDFVTRHQSFETEISDDSSSISNVALSITSFFTTIIYMISTVIITSCQVVVESVKWSLSGLASQAEDSTATTTDKIHVEEHSDTSATRTRTKRKSKRTSQSTTQYSDEDDDNQLSSEESDGPYSMFETVIYSLIAMAYVVFIALPRGIARTLWHVCKWFYDLTLGSVLAFIGSLLSGVTELASSAVSYATSSIQQILAFGHTHFNGADMDMRFGDNSQDFNRYSDDEEIEDDSMYTSSRSKQFMSLLNQSDDSEAGSSLLGQLSYGVIMAAYMLFIGLPTGLARFLKKSITWLFFYLALPTAGQVHQKVFSEIGSVIHYMVARLLVLDVWLLTRTGNGRRTACCCLLPLLFLLLLLPFLLYPGTTFLPASVQQSDPVVVPVVPVLATDNKVYSVASDSLLMEMIDQKLLALKADIKLHDAEHYKQNLVYIQQLEEQLGAIRVGLAKLENDNALLKDCCKNESVLVGLVQTGVQEQLATIMMGGSGAAVGGSGGSSSETFSNTAFVSWLNSQFAGSGDFNQKIADLTAQLNRGLQEQAEASKSAALGASQAEALALEAKSDANQAALLLAALQRSQDAQAAARHNDKEQLLTVLADTTSGLNYKHEELAAALAAIANKESIESTPPPPAPPPVILGDRLGEGCGCGSNLPNIIPGNFHGVSEEQVKLLIREALVIFGADKTGMVDYALESAGGSIISIRCSETYNSRTAQLSLFGIPLWYTSNSPRTVIQPDMHPGQCWAFKGSQGFVVIQLAGWVKPTAFSLEHIPKSLSPVGKIDSAPKDFTVWGLNHEREVEGTLLGNYTYLDNNEPLQFFQVRNPDAPAFQLVELRIVSNHGNPQYTCLYRFRVHGVLK